MRICASGTFKKVDILKQNHRTLVSIMCTLILSPPFFFWFEDDPVNGTTIVSETI